MKNIAKVAAIGLVIAFGTQPDYAFKIKIKKITKAVTKTVTKTVVKPVVKTVVKPVEKAVVKPIEKVAVKSTNAVVKEGKKQVKATYKDLKEVARTGKDIKGNLVKGYKETVAFGKAQGKSASYFGKGTDKLFKGDLKGARSNFGKAGKNQVNAGKHLMKAGEEFAAIDKNLGKMAGQLGYTWAGVVTGHDKKGQKYLGAVWKTTWEMAYACKTGPGLGCYRGIINIGANNALDFALNDTPLGKAMDKNKYTRVLKDLAPAIVDIASDAYAMNCIQNPMQAVNSIGGAAMCGSVVPKFIKLANDSKKAHNALWNDKKSETKYTGIKTIASGKKLEGSLLDDDYSTKMFENAKGVKKITGVASAKKVTSVTSLAGIKDYNPDSGATLLDDDYTGKLFAKHFGKPRVQSVTSLVRVAKVSSFAQMKKASASDLRAMEQ